MSTRTNLRPAVVLNAASMASDKTSSVTILQSLTRLSYALSWTGSTPIGAVSIQGSNDYALDPNGAVANAGTWTTLTLSYNGSSVSSIAITGNTGSGIIELITALYATRLVYTATSGTGALTVVVTGKVS